MGDGWPQEFERSHLGIQYASSAGVRGDCPRDRGPETSGGRNQSGGTGQTEAFARRDLNNTQRQDCQCRRSGRSYATRRVAFERTLDRIRADDLRGQASGLAAKVSGGGGVGRPRGRRAIRPGESTAPSAPGSGRRFVLYPQAKTRDSSAGKSRLAFWGASGREPTAHNTATIKYEAARYPPSSSSRSSRTLAEDARSSADPSFLSSRSDTRSPIISA